MVAATAQAAMSITILALNNEQLYGVTSYCASLPGTECVMHEVLHGAGTPTRAPF